MSTARKVVVLGDMRDIHHHGCEAVMSQVQKGLSQVGLPPQLVLPGLDWKSAAAACKDADLVVINGEGSLHDSVPAVAETIELAELRRESRRPTALINSSWFHNEESLTRRLAAFDLVALREARSHAAVAAAGVSCRMIPDLAISEALDHKPDLAKVTRDGFMVSDSTRPEITRRLERLAASRGWTYLPALAKPVEVRPSGKSRRIHRRVKLAGWLGPLGQALLSPRYRAHCLGVATIEEYCRALSKVRGVVTGRFHTACFALGLELPMVVVASNTPKIEAVLEDAGLDLSRRTVKPADLEAVTEVPPFTAEELASLRRFLETTRAAHRAMFSEIQSLIAGTA